MPSTNINNSTIRGVIFFYLCLFFGWFLSRITRHWTRAHWMGLSPEWTPLSFGVDILIFSWDSHAWLLVEKKCEFLCPGFVTIRQWNYCVRFQKRSVKCDRSLTVMVLEQCALWYCRERCHPSDFTSSPMFLFNLEDLLCNPFPTWAWLTQ